MFAGRRHNEHTTKDSTSPDPARTAPTVLKDNGSCFLEATFLLQREVDRTNVCKKGALDPSHRKPPRQSDELRGLPETVHVDALGGLVLPLAVLLEPYLLVHVQSMDRRSGLHKWPRDEGRQMGTQAVIL